MNPLRALRLLRAGLGDLLLAFTEWCDRVETQYADAINTEEDQ